MSPLSLILNRFSIGSVPRDAEWITMGVQTLMVVQKLWSFENSSNTLTKADTHGRKAVFRVFSFHQVDQRC